MAKSEPKKTSAWTKMYRRATDNAAEAKAHAVEYAAQEGRSTDQLAIDRQKTPEERAALIRKSVGSK